MSLCDFCSNLLDLIRIKCALVDLQQYNLATIGIDRQFRQPQESTETWLEKSLAEITWHKLEPL